VLHLRARRRREGKRREKKREKAAASLNYADLSPNFATESSNRCEWGKKKRKRDVVVTINLF